MIQIKTRCDYCGKGYLNIRLHQRKCAAKVEIEAKAKLRTPEGK